MRGALYYVKGENIMTRKETTVIALKCFAIYLVSQVLVSLPLLAGIGLKLGSYGEHDTSGFFIASMCFLSVALALLTAFFLWKLTNSLLLKETMVESIPPEIGVNEVIKIILVCMGIYFAIGALIAFPRAFVEFQIAQNNPTYEIELPLVELVSHILQFIFGYTLIAKSAKWAKLIREEKVN